MRALDQRLKRLESRVAPTDSRLRLRVEYVGHELDDTGRVARTWVEDSHDIELPSPTPVGRSAEG